MNYTKQVREYCGKHNKGLIDISVVRNTVFADIPYKTLLKIFNRLEEEGIVKTVSKGVYSIGKKKIDERKILSDYTSNGKGNRPANALNLSRQWAAGEVKMPVAKKAILECHAMAKELTDIADIALCHAIGQACSVVHTQRHAMGYPVYELTAIVRKNKIQISEEVVKQRIDYYIERLLFWQKEAHRENGTRAKFIC